MKRKNVDFSDLVGKTIISVDGSISDDLVLFKTKCGRTYQMYHYQDCCEDVYVESVDGGDLSDLIGQTVFEAKESTSGGNGEWGDTYTWTFYTIRCVKCTLTIRWYGTSNGYYSESVDFELVD